MKKLFSLVLLTFCLTSYYAQAQSCKLQRDSLIAGQRASTYSDYVYDVNDGRLLEVVTRDSGSVNVTRSYQTLYNGNNQLTDILTYNINGGTTLESTLRYTYDNNRISNVRMWGDTGVNAWSIEHDVTYDGSGNVQSIILGPTTGSPKGIAASFVDFTWVNGDLATVSLVLGPDTIELAATSDDKSNITAHLLNTDGAPYLFQSANAHNIKTVALVNDEVINGGNVPAGTLAVNDSFTYYSNNEVERRIQNPSLFNENSNTNQFFFDCSSGIFSPAAATAVSVYPNPTSDFIRLNNENFRGVVKIFDVAGKTVFSQNMTNAVPSLDVRSLKPGVYSIEMTDNSKAFRGKFVKN